MILVIDFDNTRQDILLADAGSVRRFSSPPGKGFRALEDVLEMMRGQGYERAEGIAVVLPGEGPALHPSEAVNRSSYSGSRQASGAGEKGKRDMSWSTVRAAVALANALAFAWGVPAVVVRAGEVTGVKEGAPLDAARGREVKEDILFASLAEKAIADAKPDAKVSATYDGEPNITKPKRES